MSTLFFYRVDIKRAGRYIKSMAEKKNQKVKEVVVSFVRKLPLMEKQCTICGKAFTGIKKSAYCSQACKSRANYQRNADQYRKARMEKYYAEKKMGGKK
jgi:hypothetical protein